MKEIIQTQSLQDSVSIMKVICTDFFNNSSIQDPTCNGQLLDQHPQDWQLMTSSQN
jgi:hypothetical protein